MNILEPLKKFGLDEEILFKLAENFESTKIKRNDFFIKAGEKMNSIGILIDGILVSKYSAEDGTEVVSKIYSKGKDMIVVDFYCFKKCLNSNETIQAVEDSLLLTISYDKYQKLIDKFPKVRDISTSIAEESYLKALSRIRDFQLLNAEERIKKFNEEYVDVVPFLKVKDKASYLGLSRNIYTEKMKEI